MKPSEIHGSSVVILGYGREGKSTEAWLTKHYPDLSVTVRDKQKDGESYLDHLETFDTVIRSPGISPYLPKLVAYKKQGGHVTSATNIFFSLVPAVTIGITGTKGKSTTTSLIAHILASKFPDVRLVGNIGTPMLDELDTATAATVFVIELSSHQLADIRFSPHIAVILGIVSEHLDYYPDLATYALAKKNITLYQKIGDYVIYNPAHTIVRAMVEKTRAERVIYSAVRQKGTMTYIDHGYIRSGYPGPAVPVIKTGDVPLLGNQENILAAVTVATVMGVTPESIATAIRPFRSLPHRLERIGEFRGIRFYNDSLATIPEATIHALEALGGKVSTLLIGGYDRHLDYTQLGAYLRAHPVSNLILFPDTGKRIWEAIGAVTPRTEKQHIMRHYFITSMEEAVQKAYEVTPDGTTCLLSPASASYNMFKDYADRGDQFKDWVVKLGT